MLLLKAVATALVLIAGAAVVLWYANTLNSWVLGGLIGGLAALLLSIPISLMLFTYLSHRYDGRSTLTEDDYDESEPLPYGYREVSERVMKRISVEVDDEYPAYQRGVWGEEYEDDEQHYLADPVRPQLPAPRIAASDQPSTHRPSSTQRRIRETKQLTQRDLEVESRNTTNRRTNNPGFPGYQTEKTRGQFQSQALRIAREEAYRRSEKEEEIDYSPPQRSRRPGSPRHTRNLASNWKEKSGATDDYRQYAEDEDDEQAIYPPVQQRYSQRGRRIVDANPSPNSPYRGLSDFSEDRARQAEQEEDSDPGVSDQTYTTGDLKKPLLRRAPYMYDNDALKNELSQQVDPPITRRSTRYLPIRRDDE